MGWDGMVDGTRFHDQQGPRATSLMRLRAQQYQWITTVASSVIRCRDVAVSLVITPIAAEQSQATCTEGPFTHLGSGQMIVVTHWCVRTGTRSLCM